MDVLILAGYRENLHQVAQRKSSSAIFLDEQINKTKALGLNPVVILSGSGSDELLRISRELQNVELVFDTNDREANLMTNLKAGILTVSQTCFALPLEVPCPEKFVWTSLKHAFLKTGFSTQKALIQLRTEEGAPWHWGFPLFITRLGRHLLLNEQNLASLLDPRLTYFHPVCDPAEGLEPEANSL